VAVALLTRAALHSAWMQRQMALIHEFYQREPTRLLLALARDHLEASDLNAWSFLTAYRRIDATGSAGYPSEETLQRTLDLLTLAPVSAATQRSTTLDDLLTRRESAAGTA
jgi:hypothetical protein